MGRIGVSYLAVANAASELQGKGINPTVDNVREKLNNTGSRSTIGPYLKQWRNTQEITHLQPGLPPELSSFVKGLYERLQEEANSRIEKAEQLAQEEITQLQQKFDQTLSQNVYLDNELSNLNQKFKESLHTIEQYKMDISNEQKRSLSLEAKMEECELRIQDRGEQIRVLEQQLMSTQSNLDLYRASLQAQRAEEKQMSEKEIALLTQEILTLKHHISNQTNENIELQQKIKTLHSENKILEKDWYAQRAKTMELQEQLKTNEFIIKNFEEKYSALTKDHQSAQNKIDDLQEELLKNIKDFFSLEERLREMDSQRTLAEQKVNELLREKAFILKENFDFKQQLKNIIVNI